MHTWSLWYAFFSISFHVVRWIQEYSDFGFSPIQASSSILYQRLKNRFYNLSAELLYGTNNWKSVAFLFTCTFCIVYINPASNEINLKIINHKRKMKFGKKKPKPWFEICKIFVDIHLVVLYTFQSKITHKFYEKLCLHRKNVATEKAVELLVAHYHSPKTATTTKKKLCVCIVCCCSIISIQFSYILLFHCTLTFHFGYN